MIKILLLEDTDEIAQKFINRFSGELVKVTLVKTVSELFHQINHEEYDLVLIDPMLKSTIDFPRLLDELIKRNIELTIANPGNYFPDEFKKISEEKKVDVLNLSDRDSLVEIIRELIKKKSSGRGTSGNTSELKNDQQKLEIKLIRTEVNVEKILEAVKTHTDLIEVVRKHLGDHCGELLELKNNQVHIKDTINRIDSNLGNVRKNLEDLLQKDPEFNRYILQEQERTRRAGIRISVITATIAASAVIGTATLPIFLKWIDDLFIPDKPVPAQVKKK